MKKTYIATLLSAAFALTGYAGTIKSTLVGIQSYSSSNPSSSVTPIAVQVTIKENDGVIEQVIITRTLVSTDPDDGSTNFSNYTYTYFLSQKSFGGTVQGSDSYSSPSYNSSSSNSSTKGGLASAKVRNKGKGSIDITLSEPSSYNSANSNPDTYMDGGTTVTTISVDFGKKPKMKYVFTDTYASSSVSNGVPNTPFSSTTSVNLIAKASGKLDKPVVKSGKKKILARFVKKG